MSVRMIPGQIALTVIAVQRDLFGKALGDPDHAHFRGRVMGCEDEPVARLARGDVDHAAHGLCERACGAIAS